MIKQVLFDEKVEVGISEIVDGDMRFFGVGDEAEIIKNQEKLGELLNLPGDKIVRIRTVYGDRQIFTVFDEITNDNLPKYAITNSEEQIPISDGIITGCPNVGILLPLADCLGIVIFDDEHKKIGLLHAGRQDIEQYGPKKFIEFFVNRFNSDPRKLKIYFSPYALNYKIFKFDNKLMSEVAREQLYETGVLPENIVDFEVDTVENANLPSYSSGDKAKRFAIIACYNVVK